MKNSMCVQVKNQFLSPLTNRLEKVGAQMNVPKNQFWLKRIEDGDCQKIKMKTKAKPEKAEKSEAVVSKSGKRGN